MSDRGNEETGAENGASVFGPSRGFGRGAPPRPLLEAAIVLAAFFLPAYLPFIQAFAPRDMLKATYHLSLIAVDLPRALLVLYLMAITDGLRSFGLRRFEAPKDLLRPLFTALGALGLVLCAAFAFSLLGLQNPLMAAARSGARAPWALAPLVLLSSASVGYCEELFFRSYLMRRLRQAGLPLLWSAVASSLVFGAGHGYQGIIGLAAGSLLGLYFAWRWADGEDIHEIALGHGLYDAVVTAIAIYS